MLTLRLHLDTSAWNAIEMMDCLRTKPVCTGRFKHFYHWQGVMTDLWLISVPLDKTSITSVEKLRQTIDKTHLASCFMFSIPDLKVSFSCRVKLRDLKRRKKKRNWRNSAYSRWGECSRNRGGCLVSFSGQVRRLKLLLTKFPSRPISLSEARSRPHRAFFF